MLAVVELNVAPLSSVRNNWGVAYWALMFISLCILTLTDNTDIIGSSFFLQEATPLHRCQAVKVGRAMRSRALRDSVGIRAKCATEKKL